MQVQFSEFIIWYIRGALVATCIIFCNKPVVMLIQCVFIKKKIYPLWSNT